MTLKFVPVLNRQWGFFKMKCVNDRKYNLFRQRHEYLKATALEGKKQTKITADKFMKQTVHEVEHVLRYVEATHFAQDFMEHIEHTVPRHVLHKSVAFFYGNSRFCLFHIFFCGFVRFSRISLCGCSISRFLTECCTRKIIHVLYKHPTAHTWLANLGLESNCSSMLHQLHRKTRERTVFCLKPLRNILFCYRIKQCQFFLELLWERIHSTSGCNVLIFVTFCCFLQWQDVKATVSFWFDSNAEVSYSCGVPFAGSDIQQWCIFSDAEQHQNLQKRCHKYHITVTSEKRLQQLHH